MKIYPILFKLVFKPMDAELAHKIGLKGIQLLRASKLTPVARKFLLPDALLRTEAMGLTFPSPFGIAAGFDKEGSCINALGDLGFGHVEIGTVTAQGQPGNPKPRLFRLVEDLAVINRMGFNNEGAAKVGPRLAAARADFETEFSFSSSARPIIGVNIGKTKVVELEDAAEDYRISTMTLAPQADYMVVNVSSPNTPGLRSLQSVETLRPLLQTVQEAAVLAEPNRHVPLLVKIAPDLADDEILEIADLAVELGLDGIIATNTTIARDGLGLQSDAQKVSEIGAGGLSGAPLKNRSLEVLRLLKEHVGEKLTLVSVGGVTTAGDVKERLDAGATLVQGYTAFLYEGPLWAARINRELKKLLK
ncbi:quinone-dependent dihydroorotate dehydrogenase [Rothia amarae]|uniref:Dihydroorotate dehydrogenase (quinone) n=1 Tax=Rothia amarae TaxID=169480 RepID=A0A7H2BH65_9MICC|nr:quinone-dependent dihydroorotate dehydrogenase [Rothia amarae]QNV39011.1 quinone-dependent dihydroorotate dehydrogenase [Rothia amarae]